MAANEAAETTLWETKVFDMVTNAVTGAFVLLVVAVAAWIEEIRYDSKKKQAMDVKILQLENDLLESRQEKFRLEIFLRKAMRRQQLILVI